MSVEVISRAEAREEVMRNYDALSEQLPDLLPDRQGQWVVLRDGKIVNGQFHTSWDDALDVARDLFEDRRFSIQVIVEATIGSEQLSSGLSAIAV